MYLNFPCFIIKLRICLFCFVLYFLFCKDNEIDNDHFHFFVKLFVFVDAVVDLFTWALASKSIFNLFSSDSASNLVWNIFSSNPEMWESNLFSRAILSKSAMVCGWIEWDEIVLIGPIPKLELEEGEEEDDIFVEGEGISTGSFSELWSKSKRFLLVMFVFVDLMVWVWIWVWIWSNELLLIIELGVVVPVPVDVSIGFPAIWTTSASGNWRINTKWKSIISISVILA